MRILLVNKFIFPKGGAETYTFDVGKMLEEHGHEVQYFGLENEKNYSRKSNRFICNEYGFFSRNKGKFKCTFSHYLFKRSTQKNSCSFR